MDISYIVPLEELEGIHRVGSEEPQGAKIGLTAAKTVDYKGLVLWQIEQREKVEYTCLAFKGGLSEAFGPCLGAISTFLAFRTC